MNTPNKALINDAGWIKGTDYYDEPYWVFCGLFHKCGRSIPCHFRINENNDLVNYLSGAYYMSNIMTVTKEHDSSIKSCNPKEVIDNLYTRTGYPVFIGDIGEW